MNISPAPESATQSAAKAATEKMAAAPAGRHGTDSAAGDENTAYAWYVVAVLMLAYIFSYVDRTILTLLVGPIRDDLGISDTEISLLHGMAFAIFYTALGLPLGRLADRTNRVRLITAGIVIWSVMTAACGLARNFTQLFLTRIGVGVGEAALSPAAYSIITDSFRPEKLSRAISVYVLGSYLGMGVAFMIGGLVTAAINGMDPIIVPVIGVIKGWQLAFFLIGIPGLLMAWLASSLREPERRGKIRNQPAGKSLPLPVVWAFIRKNAATLSCHMFGFGFLALLVNGAALWTPTLFVRSYGWELPQAGMIYGLLIFLFGGLGVYTGGWIADRRDRNGPAGGPFYAAALGAGLSILPSIAMPLMPNAELAIVMLAPTIFFGSLPFGLAVSAIQQITPNEMRGQISALYLLIVNLLGIGLGPTAIAVVTDYGFGNDNALHYSMAIIGGISAISATLLLMLGIKPFRRSLLALDDLTKGPGPAA